MDIVFIFYYTAHLSHQTRKSHIFTIISWFYWYRIQKQDGYFRHNYIQQAICLTLSSNATGKWKVAVTVPQLINQMHVWLKLSEDYIEGDKVTHPQFSVEVQHAAQQYLSDWFFFQRPGRSIITLLQNWEITEKLRYRVLKKKKCKVRQEYWCCQLQSWL